MSLVEKTVADAIVDWEHQRSLGHDYAPIGDVLAVLHPTLAELQRLRGVIHGMADELEHTTPVVPA